MKIYALVPLFVTICCISEAATLEERASAIYRMTDALVAVVDEWNSVIATIHDRQTADAAAPRLIAIEDKKRKLQNEMSQECKSFFNSWEVKTASPDKIWKFTDRLMKNASKIEAGLQTFADIVGPMLLMEPQCYGSDALINALLYIDGQQ